MSAHSSHETASFTPHVSTGLTKWPGYPEVSVDTDWSAASFNADFSSPSASTRSTLPSPSQPDVTIISTRSPTLATQSPRQKGTRLRKGRRYNRKRATAQVPHFVNMIAADVVSQAPASLPHPSTPDNKPSPEANLPAPPEEASSSKVKERRPSFWSAVSEPGGSKRSRFWAFLREPLARRRSHSEVERTSESLYQTPQRAATAPKAEAPSPDPEAQSLSGSVLSSALNPVHLRGRLLGIFKTSKPPRSCSPASLRPGQSNVSLPRPPVTQDYHHIEPAPLHVSTLTSTDPIAVLPSLHTTESPIDLAEDEPVLPGEFSLPGSQRSIWSLTGSFPNGEDLTGRIERRTQGACRRGGFSDVYEGVIIATGEGIAIKCLRAVHIGNAHHEDDEVKVRLEKRLMREVRVLGRVRHPRIATLLGFAMFDDKPALITPWYTNGSASEYFEANPEANRKRLIFQIAEGLAHLHGQTPVIVHADIKPGNVLVDADGDAKLSDFGLAKLLDDARTGLTTSNDPCFSIRYASPEALNEHPANSMTDIYSFGCLVFELLAGKAPFTEINSSNGLVRAKIHGVLPARSPELSDQVWALLVKCWSTEPTQRPTMDGVVVELKAWGWM